MESRERYEQLGKAGENLAADARACLDNEEDYKFLRYDILRLKDCLAIVEDKEFIDRAEYLCRITEIHGFFIEVALECIRLGDEVSASAKLRSIE